jgi:hypothetical protein
MKRHLLLICTSAWLLISQSAIAYECYALSDAFQALGPDDYYDAEPISVPDDAPALAFLTDLEGKWTGTLQESDCVGPDSRPVIKTKSAEVDAEIVENSSAFLTVKMKKEYGRGSSANDTLTLLIHDTLYALSVVGTSLEANERQRRFYLPPELLVILNDDSISDSAKQTARNKLQRGRFVEIESHIEQQGDRLDIEWHLFTNGVYVYSQTLNLQRN